MGRRLLTFAVGVGLCLKSPGASADPALAEALFREARSLLEAGTVDAACEKFEASSAIEPSSGTLLNLAACRLRQGRTATAWAYFAAAARSARAQNRPAHEAEAERRIAELEPNLSYLTIRVRGEKPGLEVLLNGRKLARGSLGSRLPVDPGPLVVEASAPGYASVKLELTLGETRDERLLTIPELRRGAVATRRREVSVSPAVGRDENNALPWIVGGVGAAALVTGGVFGLLALSSDAEAKRECHQKTTSCPDAALDAQSRRDTQATISTIGVGAGVVGVGVATVLLLTTRTNQPEAASAWNAGADIGRERFLLQVHSRF